MPDPIIGGAPKPVSGTQPVALPPAPKQDFWADPIGSLGRFLFGEASPSDVALAKQYNVSPDLIRQSDQADPSAKKGVLGGGGPFAQAVTGLAAQVVIKPIEAAAWTASHIPTGWTPGGTDEWFRKTGEYMKANDPEAYKEWEDTNRKANADFLGGGNWKSDFIRKWDTIYFDRMKDLPGDLGWFKNHPALRSPSGSVGGALVDAIGFMSLPGEAVQSQLGAGEATIRNRLGAAVFRGTRVEQIMERARRGLELNDIEATIVTNLNDGTWSEDHALAFLVRSGQGLSRDLLTQLVGSMATDPLNLAMLGTVASLRTTATGVRIAEQAGVAEDIIKAGQAARNIPEGAAVTNLQRMAVIASDVSKNPLIRPVARAARTIIDPFSVLGHDNPSKGLVDLTVALQGHATSRTYGAAAYSSAFKHAADMGVTTELQRALGNGEGNMARTWIATTHALTELMKEHGEQLFEVIPDTVMEYLMKHAPREAETRLVDWMSVVRKQFLTAADDAQLVDRIATSFGKVVDISTWSEKEKSLWHLATYGETWRDYAAALAKVDRSMLNSTFDIDRLVIQNDNILDNIAAQDFQKLVKAAAGDPAAEGGARGTADVEEWYNQWKYAVDKWGEAADLGKPSRSPIQLQKLNDRLEELIKSGALHTRLPETAMTDPALDPLVEWLGKHKGADGKFLWNLGFSPDDFHRWGFRRTGEEGRLFLSSQPFVSHVTDAVPAYRPVNDVLTNRLGQIIGPAAAGAVRAPVEAVEVAVRTMTDVVSGQRLLFNMEQRFVRNMAAHGVSVRDSKKLFQLSRDAAEMQRTTIQGVMPHNVWAAVQDTVRTSGLRDTVTPRLLMAELLDASGGDLSVMGLTSGLTQRARTRIEAATGNAGVNFTGQLTVNAFRLLRYTLNPMFYIQRITDAVYFAIIKGVPAQGFGTLEPGSELYRMKEVLDKMGSSGLSRYMAIDMPEMQLMSSFQSGMFDRLSSILGSARLEGITKAGMRLQVNNMISLAYHEMGNVVRESLDDAIKYARSRLTDATLSDAERQLYQEAADQVDIFGKLRSRYGKEADHVLSDQEVGLRYVEELFRDSSGAKVGPDGLLQFREDIMDGTYHSDMTVGELLPLHQDYVALELGYVDEFGRGDIKALREDVLHGESSIAAVTEKLQRGFNATKDFTDRFARVLQFDWNDFWAGARVSLGIESAADRNALQGIIAREAQSRGMTPVDYLSQVLPMTGGPNGAQDHLGRLIEVMNAGMVDDVKVQAGKLANIWFRTIDPSGQRTLIREWHGEMGNVIRQYEAEGTVESLGKAADLRRVRSLLERQAADPQGPAAVARGIVNDAVSFTDKHPGKTTVLSMGLRKPDGTTTRGALSISEMLGPGIRTLPPKQQAALLAHFDSLMEQFNLPIVHVDVFDQFHLPIEQGGWGFGDDTPGVFVGSADTEFGIFLSPKFFGADTEAMWANRALTEPPNELWDTLGYEGLTLSAVQGPLGVIYHEVAGHAVDRLMRRWTKNGHVALDDKFQPFMDLLARLDAEGLPDALSRYAKRTAMEGNDREWVAELGALAFTPTVDRDALPLAIRNAVEDYRKVLTDVGIWHPPTIDDPRLVDPQVIDATIGHFADTVAERAVPSAVDPFFDAREQIAGSLENYGGLGKWWGTKDEATVYATEGSLRIRARFHSDTGLKEARGSSGSIPRSDETVHVLAVEEMVNGQWVSHPTPPDLFAPIEGGPGGKIVAGNAAEFTGPEMYRVIEGTPELAMPPRPPETAATYVRGTYRRLPIARRGLDLSARDYERTFGKIGDRFESVFGLPYELRVIPLSDIAPKHGPKPELLAAYTDKVKAGSELPPLVLGRDETGKVSYIVEDGNHRFATAQAAGLTEVKAYVPAFSQDVLPESYRASLGATPSGASLADLTEPPAGMVRVFRGHTGSHGDAAITYRSETGFFGPGTYFTRDHGYAEEFSRRVGSTASGKVGSAMIPEAKIIDISVLEGDRPVWEEVRGLLDPKGQYYDAEQAAQAKAVSKLLRKLGIKPDDTMTTSEFFHLSISEPQKFEDALRATGKGAISYDTTGWPGVGPMGEFGIIVKDPSIIALEHSNVAARATTPSGASLAAGDATLGATARPGTLDPKMVAKVGRAAVSGRKHPNPDVEALARHFSQWAQANRAELFAANTRGEIGDLLSGLIANVPTDNAFHYNRSEGLIRQLVSQRIKLVERDAFRLAEMSTQRTVASRTLNHPLFGMYPTSYMWGKVLPEMIKFLAKEPFGFESPIAGYTLMRVQQAIAAQREFDPELDRRMQQIGDSETAFFLDYATPSLPTSDFRAALPLWFRNWAEKFSKGEDINPFEVGQDMLSTMDLSRWYRTPKRAIGEVNDLIHGVIDQKQTAPMPTPAAPTGAIQTLTPPLGDAMTDLQALFSGQ